MTRLLLVPVAAALALVALAGTAAAHPLGNVTTNTALSLTAGPDGAALTYVLDLAEIPTVQARQRIDADGDDVQSPDEVADHAATRCAELLAGVEVTLGGERVAVRATADPELTFPDGEAGLSTLRLTCTAGLSWALDGTTTLEVADTNAPDRIGWREVVLRGDGATLGDSDVPATSSTGLLRTYPQDRLGSPLRTTAATATIAPGDGSGLLDRSGTDETTAAGPVERLTTAYTDLVAERELTPGFAVLAVLLAIVLGSLHALAPGHGKTVMAAYVVGQRGTLRQALAIGGTVATTHTLGVLLLGLALSLSETFVPDRLFGWFEVVSGLIIVVIGVALLRRARHAGHGHGHGHGHTHGHDHRHDHTTDAPPSVDRHLAQAPMATITRAAPAVDVGTSTAPDDARTMSRRELVGLGIAGGLVPSPSALVVLLGAVAIGRAWFGVGLVAAYGIGLALTLVGAGLLLVRARTLAERLLVDDGRVARLMEVLPTVTAAIVVAAGLVVAGRGLLL